MSRLSRPRRGVTPRRPDRRASCSHCERACIVSIVHSPGEDIWTASAPTPKARGGSDMAPHEHETGTTQEEESSPALPMKEDTMDTMTMNGEDVRHELQELEKAQAASSHAGWGASHPSGDASRGDGDHGGHAGRHRRGRGGGRYRACGGHVSQPGDCPHHADALLIDGHGATSRGGDAVRSRSPRSLASAVRRRRASLGSPPPVSVSQG